MSGKLNYFVWLPPWDETLGGVVGLNALVDNLAIIGERAYGYGPSISPHSRGVHVLPGWNFNARPADSFYIPSTPAITPNNTIFVHPEPEPTLWGDKPIPGSKYFARWFLHSNAIKGDFCHVVIPKGHLVFTWQKDFHLRGNKAVGTLQTINSRSDIFFDAKIRRMGDCALIRKGWYKNIPLKAGAIFIDDYPGNDFLFKVFNTTERFICHDHQCFLPVQAALCGCLPVVMAPDGLEKYPVFKYGVAFGFGEKEIEWAKKTMHLVRDHIKSLEVDGLKQTRKFVEICEKYVS